MHNAVLVFKTEVMKSPFSPLSLVVKYIQGASVKRYHSNDDAVNPYE